MPDGSSPAAGTSASTVLADAMHSAGDGAGDRPGTDHAGDGEGHVDDGTLDPGELLPRILEQLAPRVRPEQLDAWFRNLRIASADMRDVTFDVPSVFVRDWVARNHLADLQESVTAVLGEGPRVRLQVDSTMGANRPVASPALSGIPVPFGGPAVLPPQATPRPETLSEAMAHPNVTDTHRLRDELRRDGLHHAGAGAHDLAGEALQRAHGGEAIGSRAPAVHTGRSDAGSGMPQPPLNDNLTFEQFVVGPCNRLAHAAALAISENPGRAYNPLFVYGEVGLGKTHLLQAICHSVLRRCPDARVRYLSCEEFTNRFIHSIRTGSLDAFRQLHRSSDVLVIDDVQFLAEKGRTQEEFFHTFNHLYNSHKQIVISSDRPPLEIPTVEERLVSRFKWGLVTEIETPCFETRVAIVKRKGKMRGVEFPDDVAYLIGERIDSNIRELEGAVIKVIGYATITDQPIRADVAAEALRGSTVARNAPVALQDIMDLVTEEFSISARDITGKGRSQAVSLPRQIGMFLAREHTGHSLEEVGRFFGNRDHTTVIYAVSKIKGRCSKDRVFRDMLGSLGHRLTSGRGRR